MKAKSRKTENKATAPHAQAVRESPAPYEAVPSNYAQVLGDIKARIQTARVKAALAANQEMIRLYWDIGAIIVEQQRTERWGMAVVERLATDVQREFPGISGFSPLNFCYERKIRLDSL